MRAAGDGLARKNIAIAGLRLGGFDAKGDNVSGLGGGAAREAGGAERVNVENDVIGGKCQHNRLWVADGGNCRRCRDGGSRITPHGLDHHGCLDADFLRLPASKKVKIRPRDYDRRRKHRILYAQQGLLIGRPVADQGKELLRKGIARHRPKPGPGAARQQNGDDW